MFGILYKIFLAISRNLLELQRAVDRMAVAELGKLTPFNPFNKRPVPDGKSSNAKLAADMAFVIARDRNVLSLYNSAQTRVIREQGRLSVLVVLPLR